MPAWMKIALLTAAVLLPATMKVLGDWNWYLPKWLEWLPHVTHEPAIEDVTSDGRPARSRESDRELETAGV